MRTSEQIKAEVEAKFGFFPPFFSPALQNPQVLENLWQQTLSAYVTNPLPAVFKEKLSAYLSRYCAVPYCMICHSCSLYFLGMKAKEVLKLLQSPPIEEIEIDKYLHILAQASNELMLELEFNPAVEESLLYCAIFISLEKDSAYCRSELRRLLGDVNYQHLVTFIAYVKTCHVWMEAHPEVALAADKRAIDHLGNLVHEEPGLADFFDSYEEKVRQERQSWARATAVLAERQRSLEALRKAANENLRLAKAVASVSDAVVITDPNQPDHPIVYVNSAFEQMTGYLSSEVVGRNCRFLQGADTDPQAIAQLKQGIAAQREVKTTLLNYRACGQPFWNELKISPVFSDSGDLLYFVGIGTDITERKRTESLLLGQNRILETIASGASLPYILESLTQMIEQQLSGTRCSILLLDRNGNLVLGAAPSLPESYNQAIDSVTIGPSVGSCGTAAYLGKPVIVSDIANDPLWTDLGDLALEHGLRSCWSLPIISTNDNVLGTFAVYYLQPASPSEHQLQAIEIAVHLAEIAIERQQAESALRERENRWRTMIDTEPECVKLVAADGTLLEMNAAGLAMIEVESADAVIGQSVYSLVAPEHIQAFQALHESVCNGRKGTLEFEIISCKGSRRWLETHAVPLVNESDGTFLHLAITRDLTERKQAEEAWLQAKVMEAAKLELEKEIFERQQVESALQETTTLQRAILDSANYAIISTNLDGTILTFNAAAERWLGYTASEMVGKTTPAVIHDPQEVLRRAQELSQELGVALEPGFEVFVAKARRDEVEELEWTYIRKDGSRLIVLLSVTALRDNKGNITGFLGIASDITERKRAAAALLQSEERFKAFMNNSPAVAFMKDEQGRFVYINQPFERCFNIKTADWLGKTDFDVWPEQLALQYRENDRAVLAADKSLEVVEIVPNPDGHLRHWLSFKFPCKDISGQRLLGSMAIDITERLQAQAALQQANDKLSRSVDELEQRQHEFAQLGELSDFLQACKTAQEAYTALEQLVPPLFPQTNGGIFLINDSKNLVEAVATWGSPFPSQELFAPDECWALRRGRIHHTTEAYSKLRCSHIHSDLAPASSLCIPMMAQGKAMGVLYLSLQESGGLIENKQQLAVTVADHIALSLANLKLRETLQNQSIRDALTGLFNRRYLEESLERELHRCDRNGQSLGIIMLDVDHFKSFNDTFGHSAGDAVLRELGQFLQSHIRRSDIACRYGGEELTLILPEASVEVVLERAQAICEGVKHLQVHHRRQLLGTISLSLGVAMFPEHGVTAEAVLRAADAALYRAKQQGRDRVIIYESTASASTPLLPVSTR